MRPVLRPGLRLLRRNAATLQIGIDPCRAVVLDDCPQVRAVLAALDGVRRDTDVVDSAVSAGIDRPTAMSTLRALSDWGVLEDADALLGCNGQSVGTSGRARAPDLSSLSLLVPAAGLSGGPSQLSVLWARRRRATVAIHGLAGVGATAARLLAAAGIGRLLLSDELAADALHEELLGTAPWTVAELHKRDGAADVVLLTPDAGSAACEPDRDHASALMREGVPHCVAMVRETTGVLGPFVLPGVTPCLRCLDLTRSEADLAWPALLAQLVSAGRSAGASAPAADGTLTALMGAWAAAELLAFLAGLPASTAGATLEIDLSHPSPRQRKWAGHPLCGCGWHRAATMGA